MVTHMKKMVGSIFQLRENQKKEDMLMDIYARKNLKKYRIHYSF